MCRYKNVAPLDNLLELRHDPELEVWNEGYDRNGDWSVELARQTAAQVVAACCVFVEARCSPTSTVLPFVNGILGGLGKVVCGCNKNDRLARANGQGL